MKQRIAIIGGGISGLTAAYECQKLGLDWHLYEASGRLGGIIETTRIATPEGEFILEGGPDGWVTEKPWATDLCRELGLEDQLIYSNDATRKTYILKNGALEAIPDSMRLMVPTDLAALDRSPLFSPEAKRAYAEEPMRSAELRATALDREGNQHADESVAAFTRRHFGEEVTRTLAAPLLSGVFGGDIERLSVRAVMPQFVSLEREHGSLITGLQQSAATRTTPPRPIFTSLKRGVETLTEAIAAMLPFERVHLSTAVRRLEHDDEEWMLHLETSSGKSVIDVAEYLILALPIDQVRALQINVIDELLRSPAGPFMRLAPTDASSALLVAFAWPSDTAAHFAVPEGFGYLVPPVDSNCHPERSEEPASGGFGTPDDLQLLACTFVDQKFPCRVPPNARIVRAFFGGTSADALANAADATIANAALQQLRMVLGKMLPPAHTTVRRLPRSLPQYEVGHTQRIAELDFQLSRDAPFTLLGNAYRGVGLPDLIRDAKIAASRLIARL